MKTNVDPFTDIKFVERFTARRCEHDSVNLSIDEPSIIEQVVKLEPQAILEVGCAMGFMSKKLVKICDSLIAIDQSELMITQANSENSDTKIQYLHTSLLNYSPVQTFDMVVSGMTFHLVEDFEASVRKVYSLLRPGGEFLFSQRHPLRTCNPDGFKKNSGEVMWEINSYFTVGKREYEWLGSRFECYHRPLESIVSCLSKAGFIIQTISEPQPSKTKTISDRVKENCQIPSVLLVRCLKPF